MRAIDLTGQRFGKLVVLEVAETGRVRKWRCRCDCGQESVVPTNNLRNGNSKACGKCRVPTEAMLTSGLKHGQRRSSGTSPAYRSWRCMKARVRNPNYKPRYYYGRVDMDPRWEEFEEFFADMGERPEGTTLDRIDNERGYWPSNCRWATPYQQTHNRRPYSTVHV